MDIVSYILGKNSSGGGTIVSKTITENGTYNASDDSADGYSPVTVNVPQEEPTLQEKTTTVNGEVTPDSGYDGLSKVTVNVPTPTPSLQTKSVTPSAVAQAVVADNGYDGLEQVNVSAIGSPYADVSSTTAVAADVATGKQFVAANGALTSGTASGGGVDLDDYFICSNYTSAPTAFVSIVELSVKRLPPLNLMGMTSYLSLFQNCKSLMECPTITNTSVVTNMSCMFATCNSLTSAPLLNTTQVTNMNSMYNGCSKITSIPQYNAENVMNINYFCESCSRLTNFGGLNNLGQAYLTTVAANYINYKFELNDCYQLTHDSLMNVINGLYDIATKGCNAQGLVLGQFNLAKLTATEIAIATTKGWTVS